MSFFPKLRFINSKIWKIKMEIYQEAFQWQILLDEDSQRYDLVQDHPDVYDSYRMSQIWNFMGSLRLWTMMLPDNFYRSTVDRLPFKCINPSLAFGSPGHGFRWTVWSKLSFMFCLNYSNLHHLMSYKCIFL